MKQKFFQGSKQGKNLYEEINLQDYKVSKKGEASGVKSCHSLYILTENM